MRDDQTDVLVVGAGPVGLFTAILLAEAGIRVQVVDREERTTSGSYACALHPGTLALLNRVGLASELVDAGRRVTSLAFYDGESRRAELSLAKLGGGFPFLLILPQSTLEGALEARLRKSGVHVLWNHRFDNFTQENDGISTKIEKLGGTSTGYIVPHWETVVQSSFQISARFLVGADGHNSLVRRRLGSEYNRVAGPHFFAAYEFESDGPGPDEVRVVLDPTTTNVLWPLEGNKRRWTFQLVKSEMSAEFPEKERQGVRLEQPTVDEQIRQYVEKVAHHRAPWFKDSVKKITWCTDVTFEHGVAKSFGRGRCWLAGDAAHLTGPVGAQSMNVGVAEAASLATKITGVLKGGASLQSLDAYNEERQSEWQALLGIGGGLRSQKAVSPWLEGRLDRVLSCIPGSGQDLTRLAAQIGLSVAPSAAVPVA